VLAGVPRLVTVEREEGGAVVVDPPEAGALVRRMLSLDLDGDAFLALGARDPVLGAVQARLPGLRPVLFPTPWEALVWAIVGHRVAMAQGARLKARLAAAHGPWVQGRQAFPPPEARLELDGAAVGLPEAKAQRLRALAARGAAGELEADALTAMAPEQARAWLERSPGIGPWSSAFALIRGAGFPDLLPEGERRLEAAVAAAYGEGAGLAAVADGWRPFRAWAAFLFRVDAGR